MLAAPPRREQREHTRVSTVQPRGKVAQAPPWRPRRVAAHGAGGQGGRAGLSES